MYGLKPLDEQFAESSFNREELQQNMPEDASTSAWIEKAETLDNRIQRLGPINLAAIDEHAEQETRKEYLDKQHADVTQALETLEAAIEKIDRERPDRDLRKPLRR